MSITINNKDPFTIEIKNIIIIRSKLKQLLHFTLKAFCTMLLSELTIRSEKHKHSILRVPCTN